MPYIKGENRGQFTLMPESLDDYISEENPVRVIDAFVNKMKGIYVPYWLLSFQSNAEALVYCENLT